MAYHHQPDHLHPFELQEPNSDDEMRGGIRSDGSIYSHDTGYDAANSYRSGSGTGSYAPSYTSSYTRARAELEAEAISISSSRPASSAASGLDPTLERHYDHDDLSISSTRRSSLFDEQGEQYDEDDPTDYLYDALRLSHPGSGASSNMHLSISSLRFDGRDENFDEYEPAKASLSLSVLSDPNLNSSVFFLARAGLCNALHPSGGNYTFDICHSSACSFTIIRISIRI